MIEINNLTGLKGRVDDSLIKKVGQNILAEEKREGDISLVFVGTRKIRELNKNYRGVNRATNVLSFAEENKVSDEEGLGEIIICLREIKKGAQRNKCSFEEELIRIFIHGLLHLLGYEHEKSKGEAVKMKEKEEHYMGKISN